MNASRSRARPPYRRSDARASSAESSSPDMAWVSGTLVAVPMSLLPGGQQDGQCARPDLGGETSARAHRIPVEVPGLGRVEGEFGAPEGEELHGDPVAV